jgi:hypothetical protein
MKQMKQLGVWMDHSKAILIELYDHKIDSKEVILKQALLEQEKVETHALKVHGKDQNHNQSVFFKEISDVIIDYQNVLLFGPTDVKNELFNLLIADHNFENTAIELKTTDKMSFIEKQEFVVEYFK